MYSKMISFLYFREPKMANFSLLNKAFEWWCNNEPLVDIASQIDNEDLPIIPITIWLYVSQLYSTLRALAKASSDLRASTKHQCRESDKKIQLIKLLWLVFLPLMLYISPRRLCWPHAITIMSLYLMFYINSLTKAASCASLLIIITGVSA